jgi:uncharacterized membrane protein YraQ (UPF0718 family)
MFLVITYGLVAVLVVMLVEAFVARRQRRQPETLAAFVAGIFGIGYFIAVCIATGVL